MDLHKFDVFIHTRQDTSWHMIIILDCIGDDDFVVMEKASGVTGINIHRVDREWFEGDDDLLNYTKITHKLDSILLSLGDKLNELHRK